MPSVYWTRYKVRVYYGRHEHPIDTRREIQENWEELLLAPPQRIGVDTETPSLTDLTILGIGVATSRYDAWYITPDEPDFERLLKILRDPSISKIYHNAPFDLRVLRSYGIDIWNIDDTALMSRLAMEESAVLEDVSNWRGYKFPGDRSADSMRTLFAEYGVKSADQLPPWVLGKKCCKDAMATLMLYEVQQERISMQYYKRVRQLFGPLESISRQGLKLDQDRLEELYTWYRRLYQRHYQQLMNLGIHPPGSRKQQGYLLAQRGNFLPLTKKKTQLDTSEAILMKLEDPLAKDILRFRKAEKQLGTYIEPWRGHDRAYTTLRMDAATGRINSARAGERRSEVHQEGNLQNISKNVEAKNKEWYGIDPPYSLRSIFVPDNSLFTKVDKSQVELRILAEISGDKVMKSLFKRDEDIHEDTRLALGTTRTFAKNFNYGLPYGADDSLLATTLGVPVYVISPLTKAWAERYPDAWRWLTSIEQEGIRNGHVETMGGRKIRIPLDMGEKHARNCCRNFPIQGSAFEDITNLMLDPQILSYLDITRLQIHDELIFDGDVELDDMVLNIEESFKEGHPVYDIKGRLAELSGFYSPLKAEVVERWG